MLSNELKDVNVPSNVEINLTREFKKIIFNIFFFNRIISDIYGTTFETCIVEGHSEGTMSQILYLHSSLQINMTDRITKLHSLGPNGY